MALLFHQRGLRYDFCVRATHYEIERQAEGRGGRFFNARMEVVLEDHS